MFSALKDSTTIDERQSKVISGMEPAGSHLHEDFRAALRTGQFSQRAIASIDGSLRQTWMDLFDPQVKGFIPQNYDLLRSMFNTFGDLRLSELEIEGRVCLNVNKPVPSFKEFINEKPVVYDDKIRYLFFAGATGSNFGFMPTLMDRNESYFVVPVMNGGFYLGAETNAILVRNGKSAGFAFAGYSTGVYRHGNHRHLFRDGSDMVGKVFVTQKDMDLIDQNRDRPMLIVDDNLATGETVSNVETLLRKHGVTEIYKIANDYMCLYL